ncbi:MAG: rRNA pseudouridine synthase [Clostridiales bacterium]|nr:rRNA pseudouridine synthase [Clostridiales bacterium]
MATLRLDKFLALSGERSRSEAARLLKSGLIMVDGLVERDPARKIDPVLQQVTLAGEMVADQRLQYVLLHKPAGVLTAARDHRARTVMTLVPDSLLRRKVLPVGRLDKDTTGALLFTNDGELAHRLLAPGRHVLKEYHAWVEGALDEDDVTAFAQGLQLSDFTAQPAQLTISGVSAEKSLGVLLLSEGKFHQVKRMFASRGHEVISLHRAAFGPLRLQDLPQGAWRVLTASEIRTLREAAGLEPGLPDPSSSTRITTS